MCWPNWAHVKSTLVFYESGPRLGASLAAMAEVLGNREAAVARELTKRFEEVVCGGLAELAARYAEEEPKGEIVVIIGPPGRSAAETGDVDAALREALETLARAKAAGQIAKRFGLDRAEVYARATAIKSGNEAHAASKPKNAGGAAKHIAAWWLRLQGWQIVGERVKTPRGEVDLIARRGKLWPLSK